MIHIKMFVLFNLVFGGMCLLALHPEVARILAIGAYGYAGIFHVAPFLCDMLGVEKEDKGGTIVAYMLLGGPIIAAFAAAALGIPTLFD